MSIPLWFFIVIIAHFIYAAVFLADRFVLKKAIKSEYVYTVFISLFSLLALVFAPFGLTLLSAEQFGIALLVGGSFALASLYFFKSLKNQQATHVAPFIGGLVPMFTLLFSYLFFSESLSNDKLIGIAFLILGSFIIGANTRDSKTKKLSGKTIEHMIVSALLFGLSFASTRLLFIEVGFINGIVWSRLGMVVVALLFLCSAQVRKDVRKETKKKRPKHEWVLLTNKLFGAVAYTGLIYAISLTSATVVNALQGVQYVFLIILALILNRKYPKAIDEKLFGQNLLFTVFAIGFIVTGLTYIAL